VLRRLENGDQLPNCFLGRHRLGCSLPRTVRLRPERSDHMAVGKGDTSGDHIKRHNYSGLRGEKAFIARNP
jgi:hypothetical protein